jgi:hypothetical protein
VLRGGTPAAGWKLETGIAGGGACREELLASTYSESVFFFVVKAVPVMHGHSLFLGVSPSHTAWAQCRGDICHGRNEAVDMQYEEMRNCRGDSRTIA